ncbi:MAG TPA: hypothetical protein VGM87_22795 [Roseomonas sp.]
MHGKRVALVLGLIAAMPAWAQPGPPAAGLGLRICDFSSTFNAVAERQRLDLRAAGGCGRDIAIACDWRIGQGLAATGRVMGDQATLAEMAVTQAAVTTESTIELLAAFAVLIALLEPETAPEARRAAFHTLFPGSRVAPGQAAQARIGGTLFTLRRLPGDGFQLVAQRAG